MSEDEKEHCRKAFSEEEARNIQEKLSMKLGPEYLSYRPGVGGSKNSLQFSETCIRGRLGDAQFDEFNLWIQWMVV